MCGIFAYTGNRNAAPILLDGLERLEYRGYDSAGLFMPASGVIKTSGAVAALRSKVPHTIAGSSGIAHLRWATHGEPTERNAHPHTGRGDVWVVHNGIIENYRELKRDLEARGHTFVSDTDTEVIAHLIEDELESADDFVEAALRAVRQLNGTYGLAIQCRRDPDTVIAARMGAPLVIGIGESEHFIASDAAPLLPFTSDVLFLEDGEVAVVSPESYRVLKLDATPVARSPESIDWSVEAVQKGGHEHFMIKEIMEEADAVRNASRGRILLDAGTAQLGGLAAIEDRLEAIDRIMLVGCGTASYAALAGKYMIESFARVPVEVDVASEFRYRQPIIDERTAVIAVSQSGETADTLEAVREGKRRGALTLGIVNVVGSTIARETDAGIYLHCGPEVSVASTKAYVSQLTALALFALKLGRDRGRSAEEGRALASALLGIPAQIEAIYGDSERIQHIAERYAASRDFLYMGRMYNLATAFEGALKLKETSYVHAEGCSSGEMKHGHLAMIDPDFPTVAIAPSDSVYEKNISNIQEIRTRKGPVIAIATEGNEEIESIANDVITITATHEMLSPLLAVVPLHLFAYYVARTRGIDPDRPRNLAKSVTVE